MAGQLLMLKRKLSREPECHLTIYITFITDWATVDGEGVATGGGSRPPYNILN